MQNERLPIHLRMGGTKLLWKILDSLADLNQKTMVSQANEGICVVKRCATSLPEIFKEVSTL